jgi:hypothetical protein
MIPGSHTSPSIVARERCLDLARRWLTVCSKDSCHLMLDALVAFPDEKLASMCILNWGLDQPQGDENDLSWFEAHGADRNLLIWAFSVERQMEHETLTTKEQGRSDGNAPG